MKSNKNKKIKKINIKEYKKLEGNICDIFNWQYSVVSFRKKNNTLLDSQFPLR